MWSGVKAFETLISWRHWLYTQPTMWVTCSLQTISVNILNRSMLKPHQYKSLTIYAPCRMPI